MSITALAVPIAPKGLATAFEPTETPESYALKMRNRFISAAGGAEKRQGMSRVGNLVSTAVDRLHEHVNNKTLVETLFASGGGRIYRYDTPDWSVVYTTGNATAKYRSVQVNDKLIFYNGIDRPIYTTDGISFYELRAIVEGGVASTGTDQDSLQCADITNWKDSDVSIGDIVQYGPYGYSAVVTAITTASVQHTQISASAPSLIGLTTDGYNAVGAAFKIIDTVEANVVPTSDPEFLDNVGVAATGTTAAGTKISNVTDWITTDISVGDYIRNTTRSAVAMVTAVTTGSPWLKHTGITGHVAGDSLVFYKSAMPRPSYAHVHYGRFYAVDSRSRDKIRISGPNNPNDMTTDAGTLEAASLSFGALQPEGDAIQSMVSYQRFLVISGKRYTFLYEGSDPIVDTSGMDQDFDIIGMFPQGVMSPDGLVTVGNDAVIISRDGIQGFSLQSDSSSLGRENLSEALKNVLRKEIANADENEIIAFHYPKRSWVCFRIGQTLYVYNYTPYFGEGGNSAETAFSTTKKGGSWSIFDGLIAEQDHYLVRRSGDLYSCKGNTVYRCDVDGVYTDDGKLYTTEYQTTWLKGPAGSSQNVKVGHYIQPVFNAVNTTYTIKAEAPFVPESSDNISTGALQRTGPIGLAVIGSYAIGGAGSGGISDQKYPLLWRGKEVKFTITTYDAGGPDTIARFIVFYNTVGVR